MTGMILESFIFLLALSNVFSAAVVPPDVLKLSPKAANQPLQCHVGSDAWPKLWVDVILLIDNSADQTLLEFITMKNKIKQIWQAGSGGPTVGLETGKTRVGVIAFSAIPRIIATPNQLHSNTELTNAIDSINQTTSPTVNGASALTAAAALLTPMSGGRPNAPNAIIIYTANWDGNNACQMAQTIMRTTVIMAVGFNNPNQTPLNMPSCTYWPGEMYAPDGNLEVSLLTSLSYVNCDCPGRSLPDNNRRSEKEKTDRALLPQWYQFWLPQDDGKYYLRDKWAECVRVSVIAVAHDTAQRTCHMLQAYLANEYSSVKHNFLASLALSGNIQAYWIGLQYDNATQQWYWDNFDRTTNQPTRTMVEPGDFTSWNTNQPNTTVNQYCVKESPATGGQVGFRWTSAKCSGLFDADHLQPFCQVAACDAFNYCTSA